MLRIALNSPERKVRSVFIVPSNMKTVPSEVLYLIDQSLPSNLALNSSAVLPSLS